jgi:hypothetical protein
VSATESFYYEHIVPGMFSATTAPTLASSAPNSGTHLGGVPLSLTGTGFAVGCDVIVGDVEATGIIRVSNVNVTCVSPPTVAGVMKIYVINPDGTASNTINYTAT